MARRKKKRSLRAWLIAWLEPKAVMQARLHREKLRRRAAEKSLELKEQENRGLRIQLETFTDFAQRIQWENRANGLEAKTYAKTIEAAGRSQSPQ